MKTRIIEATNGFNHGKFLLGRHDVEWSHPTAIDDSAYRVLSLTGWSPRHLLVLDLATGEGAMFQPGGMAAADLDKHRIWVCPMFEPFLTWLYRQDLSDLDALPLLVELEAGSALYGYRRPGPQAD